MTMFNTEVSVVLISIIVFLHLIVTTAKYKDKSVIDLDSAVYNKPDVWSNFEVSFQIRHLFHMGFEKSTVLY